MAGEEMKQGAGAGGPNRLGAIKAKVDELGALTRQAVAARTAAKRMRMGVSLVLVLVFVAFILGIYSTIKTTVNTFQPATVVNLVQTKMLSMESNTMKQALAAAGRAASAYRAEVELQFGDAWPEMRQKLEDEGKTYLTNVASGAQTKIDLMLADMARKQQDKVWAAFGELKEEKDRDMVLKNLEIAIRDAALDVFNDRVAKAEDRLLSVHERIIKFLPKESQDTFQQRMSRVWENFLIYDLGGMKIIP